MQRFVIVVDMQRDFVATDGALPVSGAEAIVAPMQAWLSTLRPADTAGILFTADTHVPEIYGDSPEATQFPPHCKKRNAGMGIGARSDRDRSGHPRLHAGKGYVRYVGRSWPYRGADRHA